MEEKNNLLSTSVCSETGDRASIYEFKPAFDRNRDMAPDPDPDSRTQSPSVTSIIINIEAASWGKKNIQ